MYGGKRMFVIGVGWLVICSILAGVSQGELMLDFARALQGLGPAAFLPSSVMLLGSVYRPGPRKNLVSTIPVSVVIAARQSVRQARPNATCHGCAPR
jgi:MFS family permease